MCKIFRIFSSNPAIRSCLKVVEQGVRATVGTYDECEKAENRELFWQWWAPDTTHLKHVLTGLCLSTALPPSSIRRIGFVEITLEKCVVGNSRQVSTDFDFLKSFIATKVVCKS